MCLCGVDHGESHIGNLRATARPEGFPPGSVPRDRRVSVRSPAKLTTETNLRGDLRGPNADRRVFNQLSHCWAASPLGQKRPRIILAKHTICWINCRTLRGSRGLPAVDFQRQNSRKPLRCQPTSVSGLTTTSASRQLNSRDHHTKHNRAASVRRWGSTWCSL
jgi:hypothetical protein